MKLNKMLLLASVPFALCACDEGSSTSAPSDPSSVSSSSGADVSGGVSSSVEIEWVLPNDPSNLWSGEGSEASPYMISSESDLGLLVDEVNNKGVNFKDVYFKLAGDISLSKKWTPIGCVKGMSNRTFGGTFDGAGKTIKGLSIDDTASVAGLFGYVNGGVLKNIVIDGAQVKAGSYSGLLFGKAENAKIQDCSVSGTIVGTDFVGGLGGSISANTSVENVVVLGSVQGNGSVGGVVASSIGSTLKNAQTSASVSGKATVGGVVATLSMNATVELCVNKGDVSGTQDVAGVVAKVTQASVKQSGNEGAIKGEDNAMSSVGGIVAVASNKAALSQVYNTGAVSAANVIAVGGIAGKFVTEASITNAFNHGEIKAEGNTYAGGIAGKAEVCTITAAYNAGVIPKIASAASIAGGSMSTSVMTSVYYDLAMQLSAAEPGVAVENLKTAEFTAELNAVENVWTIADGKYAGFPIFTWMN